MKAYIRIIMRQYMNHNYAVQNKQENKIRQSKRKRKRGKFKERKNKFIRDDL